MTIHTLNFTVPGQPVPKARPRLGRWGAFTPSRTQAYERLVSKCAALAKNAAFTTFPYGEDVRYQVDMIVSRARRVGDIDNFLKSIMDGLNEVVWPDDKAVWAVSARFQDDKSNPCVKVTVTCEVAS